MRIEARFLLHQRVDEIGVERFCRRLATNDVGERGRIQESVELVFGQLSLAVEIERGLERRGVGLRIGKARQQRAASS